MCPCPALGPRWTLQALALAGWRVLPSAETTTSAPRSVPFEALSRGLDTPCVRFAAGVAPGPRNTRYRLVANLCRDGTCTRLDSNKRFQCPSFLTSTSLPSRLRLAQCPRKRRKREAGSPEALEAPAPAFKLTLLINKIRHLHNICDPRIVRVLRNGQTIGKRFQCYES